MPAPARSCGRSAESFASTARRRRRAEGDLGDRQPAFEERVGERDRILGAFDGDDGNDADRGDRQERVGHAGLGVSSRSRQSLPAAFKMVWA